MVTAFVVRADIDPTGISILAELLSKDLINIVYTSPYYAIATGGVLAIPEIGSEILCAEDDTDPNKIVYYYVSTIVRERSPNNKHGAKLDGFPIIPGKYNINPDKSSAIKTFQDERSTGLRISSYRSEKSGYTSSVTLNSLENNIVLSDSPNQEGIFILNRNLDGISIIGDKNIAHGANSIQIRSAGSQKCEVENGSYLVNVKDGQDITLINQSKGTYAPLAISPMFPSSPTPELQFGNINLISSLKDINVFCNSLIGSIYIGTPGPLIQITADGFINIISKTMINIDSQVAINLRTTGLLNLEGGAGVNIKSLGPINIKSDTVLAAEGGVSTFVGAGGISPLQLNFPAGTPAKALLPTPPTIATMSTLGLPITGDGAR
jgi:hypothetical protein